jgi:hypothetical protein
MLYQLSYSGIKTSIYRPTNRMSNGEKMSNWRTEPEQFEDGAVELYKRINNGEVSDIWTMTLHATGMNRQIKSTRLTDKEEARKFAVRAYYRIIEKKEEGLSLVSLTFKAAAKKYFLHLDRELERKKLLAKDVKSKKSVFDRFFTPYLGEKELNVINKVHLNSYNEWRLA